MFLLLIQKELPLVHREEKATMVDRIIIQYLSISYLRASTVAPHNPFPRFREELLRVDPAEEKLKGFIESKANT